MFTIKKRTPPLLRSTSPYQWRLKGQPFRILKPLLQGEVAQSAGGVYRKLETYKIAALRSLVTERDASNDNNRQRRNRAANTTFVIREKQGDKHHHRHCEERSDEAIYLLSVYV